MKKVKIQTLTPVHIGTGETIEPVCFQPSGKNPSVLNYYRFQDVMSLIPMNKETYIRFLTDLAANSNKRDFYRQIAGNTRKLSPVYQVKWNFSRSFEQEFYTTRRKKGQMMTINEQVKSLAEPIIPGSSIKGAVECALKYSFLKSNLSLIRNNIDRYCRQQKGKKTRDSFLFSLVYGESDHSLLLQREEFLKALNSCISVRDIQFHDLELLSANLYHLDADKSNKDFGTAFCEVIPAKAETESVSVIQIVEHRVRRVKEQYGNDPKCRELIALFTDLDVIRQAVNDYGRDTLKALDNSDYQDLYDYIGSGSYSVIKNVFKQTDVFGMKPSKMILRLGAETFYFSKTVSWLFKMEFPDHFDYFFDSVFSPVKKADPEYFPDTTKMFENDKEAWLPGYVSFEICS